MLFDKQLACPAFLQRCVAEVRCTSMTLHAASTTLLNVSSEFTWVKPSSVAPRGVSSASLTSIRVLNLTCHLVSVDNVKVGECGSDRSWNKTVG